MSYRLLEGGGVLRYSDGASVPEDRSNRDWREYLEWVAAGNIPDPVVVDTKDYPSIPAILDALIKAVLDNNPVELQLIREKIGNRLPGPLPR